MSEIETLYEDIELKGSLENLMLNKDFQKLFLEKYVKEGSVQLVKNLTQVTVDKRAPIMERMVGMSRFMQFMDEVNTRAESAQEYLAEIQNQEPEGADHVL